MKKIFKFLMKMDDEVKSDRFLIELALSDI